MTGRRIKWRMLGIDEISERLTNRFIRKNPAGCDELEYYQQRLKNRMLLVRNFIIAFVSVVIVVALICVFLQFY